MKEWNLSQYILGVVLKPWTSSPDQKAKSKNISPSQAWILPDKEV